MRVRVRTYQVDKLRAALGVEGGADQVLAEEERTRAMLATKEDEYKVLVGQVEAVMSKALALAPDLGSAGEAKGEGDSALCERVGRVLDAVAGKMRDEAEVRSQQLASLKNREFENELLKKQLQLRGGSGSGSENAHPNSGEHLPSPLSPLPSPLSLHCVMAFVTVSPGAGLVLL